MKAIILLLPFIFTQTVLANDFPGFTGKIMNYTQTDMKDLKVVLMNCKPVRRSSGGIIISVPSGGGCTNVEIGSADVSDDGVFTLEPTECEKCRNIGTYLYKKNANSGKMQKIAHLITNRFDNPLTFNLLKLNSPVNRAKTDTGVKLSEWLKREKNVRGVNVKYKFYEKNKQAKPILEHKDMYENGLGNQTADKPESYQSANRYFTLISDGSVMEDVKIKADIYLQEDLYGETKLSSASFIQSPDKISVPVVTVETKKYRTTLDGGYIGEVQPMYKEGTFDALTKRMRIDVANVACVAGKLNGALIMAGRVVKIRNGICGEEMAEFDVANIPLELTETGELVNFSGRAIADRVTHRYVSIEVCNAIENKCIDISLHRRD